MTGRTAGIYLPMPYCKNGHKRNAKNTIWRTQSQRGGKYIYQVARCAICASSTQRRYYVQVVSPKRLRGRSRECGPQHHPEP
jgi:hypothetical protein